MRPTLRAQDLAEVPEEQASAFARATLEPFRSAPNPYVVQWLESEGFRDCQVEAGRWLLLAQRHGYLDEVLRDLRGAAFAPEDNFNTSLDRYYRSFLARMAEVMATYFFVTTGWSFRRWNPLSFQQEKPPFDVDFVLGSPDGQDAFVQVKSPNVPGVLANRQYVGGDNDQHVWEAITKGMGQLPRPARGPSLLVVHAHRSESLAYRPYPVDGKLLGTTVQEGGVVSIPSVYRGAFFTNAWSHLGAVVLLDNNRGEDEFLYTCTVYLNPRAEAEARCEASWFRGARVCQLVEDTVRWTPEPPAIAVPEGTRVAREAEEGLVPDGTRLEPDVAEQVFRPMNPALLDDPIMGPSLCHLRDHDPQVLAMVAEVDRSLIWDALGQPPSLRLRRSAEMAHLLEEARRGPR